MRTGRSPEPEPERDAAVPWTWRLAMTGGWRGRWPAGLAGLAGLVLFVLLALGEHEPTRGVPATAPAPTAPVLAAVRVEPGSPAARAELLARAHDVWSEHDHEAALDVVLDPAGLLWLRARGLPFTVLVPDVQAVAAAERSRLDAAAIAKPPAPDEWFHEYRDLEAIHAHLEDLARLRPDLARTETLGTSLEGRPLLAIRIRGRGERHLGMLVDSGLHAREWISMMVGTCVADRLLRGYDDDPRVQRFVDATELVVVPVANPDGYVHSWRRDRYWRKNRRGDHGVDLNRNFGVAWGGEGSSNKPASQVYRGAAPFSEPEAQALRRLVDAEGLSAHVDLHSYGQLLLHPWSYTREQSRDHRRLAGLAERMVKAIAAEHHERYRLMPGESLYPASGTLMDWAHGEHGIASFVIELRPRGGSGFVLPPDQIAPTCDEGLAAVLALGEGLLMQ
jgi:murein tripeptide amidase MpaA